MGSRNAARPEAGRIVRELIWGVKRLRVRRLSASTLEHPQSICNCKAIVTRNLRNFTGRRYIAEERIRASSLRISIWAISGPRVKHGERVSFCVRGLNAEATRKEDSARLQSAQ